MKEIVFRCDRCGKRKEESTGWLTLEIQEELKATKECDICPDCAHPLYQFLLGQALCLSVPGFPSSRVCQGQP